MSPGKSTKQPATRADGDTFTAEERAAMKERAKEVRARKQGAKVDDEATVLEKIAGFSDADRKLAERLHQVIRSAAPELTSRLWYGMPAYAKNGKVLCFVQPGAKFKTRYTTLGFSDTANLDDGTMWATSYALTKLTAADEKRIAALVKQAAR